MFKIKQIASGLGLALALSLPAYAADTIVFDPDGAGAANGDINIQSFDWFPGSAITVGVIPTQTGEFQTYAHGTLLGMGDENGDPVGAVGLGSSFEITFVSSFTEAISSVSNSAATLQNNNGAPGGGDDIYTFNQSIVLGDPAGGGSSFFQIYWDDSRDANSLAGTGYNDGLLIAEGTVSQVSGNFVTQFTFVDTNNNGAYDIGVDTIIGSGNPAGGYALLDSAGADQWGGQVTVTGAGATTLSADLTFAHADFFKSNITGLVFDLQFNTSNVLPFQETNPSQSYWNGSSQVALGSPGFQLGEVNGLNGPDIIFQADANNSFNVTREVPAPQTVMLLALGLLLLGVSSRRVQRSPTMAA